MNPVCRRGFDVSYGVSKTFESMAITRDDRAEDSGLEVAEN